MGFTPCLSEHKSTSKGIAFLVYTWTKQKFARSVWRNFGCNVNVRETKWPGESIKYGFSSCYKFQWWKFNLWAKQCLWTIPCRHFLLMWSSRVLLQQKLLEFHGRLYFRTCSWQIMILEKKNSILIDAMIYKKHETWDCV